MNTAGSSSASVPLTEVLPWPSPPPNDGRCFVVYDSVETDGRFLLHALASQVILQSSQHVVVMWVACGPWTEKLVRGALKKMACDASGERLHVRSVTVDLSTRLQDDVTEFDEESYIKELYHSIVTCMPGWIVIDDVSALANLVGERLAYCFLLSLRAHCRQTSSSSMVVRCSHDVDMELVKEQQDANSVIAGGSSRHVDWVGAGGGGGDLPQTAIPWERTLAELANGIIHVEPLASGYSREAHGRLVFCEYGRGWGHKRQRRDETKRSVAPSSTKNSPFVPLVLNFCCHDTTVTAIRLRGPASSS